MSVGLVLEGRSGGLPADCSTSCGLPADASLTALGASLSQPLSALRTWTDAHYAEVVTAREAYEGKASA